MKTLSLLALAAVIFPLAGNASAGILTHISSSITSSGGAGGSGVYSSDMVFPVYSADGWGWAGGAGAVQGNLSITNTSGTATPSNEAFHFDIGSSVDTLNATYGTGNWTITNFLLNFNSSYAKQNNSRFGVGSGTFDIYWVANDNWAQTKGTTTDKQLNPIYASTQTDLNVWAGTSELLGSEAFTIPAGGSGYVNLNYNLSVPDALVQDVLTSSASSNKALSLYLMGTSDTLGMIIFTGGQGQSLPTISFDVIAAPEPASLGLLGLGVLGILGRRKLSR